MGVYPQFSPLESEVYCEISHKAKTPIIAGSVCGSLLFVAWFIGFVFYLVRRRRKKLRARQVAAGVKLPKAIPKPPEKYIIPPDPAVVLGQMQPGERIIVESKHKPRNHSKTTENLDEHREKHPGGYPPGPNPEPSSSHLDAADTHLLVKGMPVS